MKYWITKEGMYYESEYKLQKTDVSVSKRPEKNCNYINGSWVCPATDDAEDMPHHKEHVCCDSHVQQTIPQQVVQQKKDEVILSENTKLIFGVKDMLMVGAFIVTAVISWKDTDARIAKLEDNTSISQLEAKLKSLDGDLKMLDKQTKDSQQKIEQNIRELEQVIFMRNQGRLK